MHNPLNDLLDFIKSVGVPAALAFLVLWRLDQRLWEISEKLSTLITLMHPHPR